MATDGVTEANTNSNYVALSGDGRYVAFSSRADNLVPGDTNNTFDIFLRDTVTGNLSRISTATDGTQANFGSRQPDLSADGAFTVFTSDAGNLVTGDTNNLEDIFLRNNLTGAVSRVSIAADGTTEADRGSVNPAISADGRFVAYSSRATNLVTGDTNLAQDIFLRDLQTNALTLVSVTSAGLQADNQSYWTALSADGRYVAFSSSASNLVSGDTNNLDDIFVRDTLNNTTARLSVLSAGADGAQANGRSSRPQLSADGRYVVFDSLASNLVANDTNNSLDVFVLDTQTGTTLRVSVATDGTQGDSSSYHPVISADGRFIAFRSKASVLVSNDTNGATDIFLRDLQAGTTKRVSVAADGAQGVLVDPGFSTVPLAISGDGRFIGFESDFVNLVPGDTNGATDIFTVTGWQTQ